MNIRNIMLFAENLSELAPETQILEQVVAVFATPPNSYSAVTDPIDLVSIFTRSILKSLVMKIMSGGFEKNVQRIKSEIPIYYDFFAIKRYTYKTSNKL